MRSFAIHTKFAFFAATLLATSLICVSAQEKAVSAKVRAVRGSAKYAENGTWNNLRVNDVLRTGTVIETGPDSTVDLFINNSVIRITPDTTFGVTKALATNTGAETVTETEIYLKSGRILGNVKKLAAASKYQIKTPNGVTGIRGTALEISYLPGPDGTYRLIVRSIDGTLVSSAQNSKRVMKTGVVNTGEAWSPEEDITLIPLEYLSNLRSEVPPFDDSAEQPVTQPIPQTNPLIDFVSPSSPN